VNDRFVHVEQVMGMPVSIHVRGPQARTDPEVAAAAARAVRGLHDVDAVFSTWKRDSAVSRIRRGELTLDDAPPDVREVARLCRDARDRTDGWFDGWLPDGPTGPRLFEPTGLVKGWAVQRACELLRGALPAHDVLVDAGGDIALACNRVDTPGWTVGVEDPRDRTRVLATLQLRAGGVATSGSAARGAHVLDPRTGGPGGAGLLAVTVVAPDLVTADVDATAAFARGTDADRWLAGLPGRTALVVPTVAGPRTVQGAAVDRTARSSASSGSSRAPSAKALSKSGVEARTKLASHSRSGRKNGQTTTPTRRRA
jgi:thiamine biosynthesis lipoprotein